jgi:glycosyltransferase involved in cell wall biosynthesis
MPKISVIIPVYNTEKYLRRCLESVCNQTLKDIQIICVDDCSSDGSSQILKEYEANHKNLTVSYLVKNQGVSNARNVGLLQANGEYVAFVDSDDEIDLNFYEKLYEKAKAENADLVKGQAIEISYKGQKNVVKQIPQNSKWFFVNYWLLAIFKRSLILENNISFSTNHKFGEDLLFLNKAIIAAQNLYLVDEVYYHYYKREDSEDSKNISEEKIKSALNVFELIADSANENLLPNGADYNFIFHNFIMCCFNLSLKNDDKKAKKICAQAALNIFKKCWSKDGLKINFSKTAPQLFELLENNDRNGIEDVLAQCKTPICLILSGLRAKIKNNMKDLKI